MNPKKGRELVRLHTVSTAGAVPRKHTPLLACPRTPTRARAHAHVHACAPRARSLARIGARAHGCPRALAGASTHARARASASTCVRTHARIRVRRGPLWCFVAFAPRNQKVPSCTCGCHPHSHAQADCTMWSRSKRQHRRPPHVRRMESWVSCGRRRELLAHENVCPLSEVDAHTL